MLISIIAASGGLAANRSPILTWMGVGGSAYALYWTFRASRESFAALRSRYAAIATLAAMFLVSYLVLLFLPVDETAWIDFTRGMGFVCWFTVWAEPARRLIRASKKLDASIEQFFENLDQPTDLPEPCCDKLLNQGRKLLESKEGLLTEIEKAHDE